MASSVIKNPNPVVETDTLTGGLISGSWGIRKVGDRVYLSMGDLKAFSAGSITILSSGGIPADYRPKQSFQFSVTPRGAYNTRNLGVGITAEGGITAYNYGSATTGATAVGDVLEWTTL